jgi:hypothetical protein
MKFIKTFESFHETGVDDGIGEVVPEYNPVLINKITEYVDDLATRGQYHEVAKMIGMKIPKEVSSDDMDSFWEKIRDKAIKFLVNNPELIGKEIGFDVYKVPGGDGVSRTNNVGGVWGQTR